MAKKKTKKTKKPSTGQGASTSQSTASSSDMPSAMQPFTFWVNQAHKNADARTLADSLGLDLPKGNMSGFKAGLKYPVRRLVVTGKDTPENFLLLFGVDCIPDIHAETRREVLLSSTVQEGSPSAMMNGFFDEGCPAFSPRPATEAELEDIQKMNQMLAAMMGQ